jgi:hypothetical protein
MTRLPYALMLTSALCVLSAPSAHAGQRQHGGRHAERSDPESSAPSRAAVPRGEAARPAPDSGRGASSAGSERGVDNAGRSRIPARFDEGRVERTPEAAREAARARVPRSSAPTPDASNGSSEQVNVDQARRANDSSRGGAVIPRWPIARPAEVIRTETTAERADDDQRHAVPRGSRPRGDNPSTGTAVPRVPDVSRGSGDQRGGNVSVPRGGRTFNNYYNYYPRYYYPRRWYPYGFGAFGLGYFYYDPYAWYGYDPYGYGGYPYYGGVYGGYPYGGYPYGGYPYGGYPYPSGGYSNGGSSSGHYEYGDLRLQVEPREAEVFVDGYFAGHVDDFDGIFQSLTLEEGPHKIEIVAPGFETLDIDIRILPGRKITYKGELKRRL